MGKKTKRRGGKKRYDVSVNRLKNRAIRKGAAAREKTGIWPSPKFQCHGGR